MDKVGVVVEWVKTKELVEEGIGHHVGRQVRFEPYSGGGVGFGHHGGGLTGVGPYSGGQVGVGHYVGAQVGVGPYRGGRVRFE